MCITKRKHIEHLWKRMCTQKCFYLSWNRTAHKMFCLGLRGGTQDIYEILKQKLWTVFFYCVYFFFRQSYFIIKLFTFAILPLFLKCCVFFHFWLITSLLIDSHFLFLFVKDISNKRLFKFKRSLYRILFSSQLVYIFLIVHPTHNII